MQGGLIYPHMFGFTLKPFKFKKETRPSALLSGSRPFKIALAWENPSAWSKIH